MCRKLRPFVPLYHTTVCDIGRGSSMEKGEQSTAGPKKNRGPKKAKKPLKATPMSRQEMLELVSFLEKFDYDGKLKTYQKPNARKDRILEKVIQVIEKKHGILRSKDQLRKRWSDLKNREQAQLKKIHVLIEKRKNKQKNGQRINSTVENNPLLQRATGSSSNPGMTNIQTEEIIQISPTQDSSPEGSPCNSALTNIHTEDIITISPTQDSSPEENQRYHLLEEMQTDHSGMEVWDHPLSERHQNLDLIEITPLVEDVANARAITDGSQNIVSSTGNPLQSSTITHSKMDVLRCCGELEKIKRSAAALQHNLKGFIELMNKI
ncbi:uncharacterized protein LOC120928407 isoform X1 [Rana temporaria]|uniref:uncharacterized protein LOC120928407 isoform X1 n=1 Tax=Rana temporaria TaxID=8407 RepID=UPI001AACAFFD|nr:uncharacterized protein LOC120928407 isoform X1 [Rana temporaria]